MASQTLPLIKVRGTSFERGFQHGQQCGDLIRRYPEVLLKTVAAFQNALSTPVWRASGIPHYFLKRRLLEQTSLAGCLDVIARVRTCSSGNYVLADRDTVVDVEVTPDGYAVVAPTEGVVVHANHFCDVSPLTCRGRFGGSMRSVRIGTYQLPADVEGETDRERKACQVQRVLEALREVGRAGVDLACVGETCTTSHLRACPDDGAIYEDALTGPTVRSVAEIAKTHRMNVALPIAATWRGALRNLVVLVDRQGAVAGVYAKVHPTRSERAMGIVPGEDIPVFRLDVGVVGALICHDLSFVESARVLALRGAEILVWPTWWSGWGDELCEAVIASRAIDNGCWLVRAGYGYAPSRAWRPGMQLGRSGVIGPDGIALSSCGRAIGPSVATIDLDAERIAHSFSWGDEGPLRRDLFADRRPEVYGPLVDPALVPPAREPARTDGLPTNLPGSTVDAALPSA